MELISPREISAATVSYAQLRASNVQICLHCLRNNSLKICDSSAALRQHGHKDQAGIVQFEWGTPTEDEWNRATSSQKLKAKRKSTSTPGLGQVPSSSQGTQGSMPYNDDEDDDDYGNIPARCHVRSC